MICSVFVLNLFLANVIGQGTAQTGALRFNIQFLDFAILNNHGETFRTFTAQCWWSKPMPWQMQPKDRPTCVLYQKRHVPCPISSQGVIMVTREYQNKINLYKNLFAVGFLFEMKTSKDAKVESFRQYRSRFFVLKNFFLYFFSLFL